MIRYKVVLPFCQNVNDRVISHTFQHRFFTANMLVTSTKHNKTLIKINQFIRKMTELSFLYDAISRFQHFFFFKDTYGRKTVLIRVCFQHTSIFFLLFIRTPSRFFLWLHVSRIWKLRKSAILHSF